MPNTDKELALLAAEEEKLLEQQRNEREALKKKLATVKKQIREEQRKMNERRAALLGHCMMQKFNSDPEPKNAILLARMGHQSGNRLVFGYEKRIAASSESWSR